MGQPSQIQLTCFLWSLFIFEHQFNYDLLTDKYVFSKSPRKTITKLWFHTHSHMYHILLMKFWQILAFLGLYWSHLLSQGINLCRCLHALLGRRCNMLHVLHSNKWPLSPCHAPSLAPFIPCNRPHLQVQTPPIHTPAAPSAPVCDTHVPPDCRLQEQGECEMPRQRTHTTAWEKSCIWVLKGKSVKVWMTWHMNVDDISVVAWKCFRTTSFLETWHIFQTSAPKRLRLHFWVQDSFFSFSLLLKMHFNFMKFYTLMIESSWVLKLQQQPLNAFYRDLVDLALSMGPALKYDVMMKNMFLFCKLAFLFCTFALVQYWNQGHDYAKRLLIWLDIFHMTLYMTGKT